MLGLGAEEGCWGWGLKKRAIGDYSTMHSNYLRLRVNFMTLELASEQAVHKPWGTSDLRPWSDLGSNGALIGELWFQRADLRRQNRHSCSSCSSPTRRSPFRCILTTRLRVRWAFRMARPKRGTCFPKTRCRGVPRTQSLSYAVTASRSHRRRHDRRSHTSPGCPCGRGDRRPGEHHSRYWRRSRDRRDTTTQQCDVSALRPWP